MRIKSDVEFVKSECEKYDLWEDGMDDFCGREVISCHQSEVEYCTCFFHNDEVLLYPASYIEGLAALEKGKMYTVNGSTDSFEFLEESKNFVIFEGGIVFKKEGNTFTEYDPKPEFLKKEWRVEKLKDDFVVYCGGFGVCTIGVDGLYPNKNLSSRLGFPLDENGAIKLVK